MKQLKIEKAYCTLTNVGVVEMFFINKMPFTFDELEEDFQEQLYNANPKMASYDMEDLYRYSNYLIMEGCHPILFQIEEHIENPQDIPL
jgi:hypothetical protein